MNIEIVFLDEECTCEDPPGMHDDGIGCTAPGCPCLAQWEFEVTP